MKLEPGTLFASDYEVVRELSAGGMGAVYVVLQRSTGKQRALKLMLPQLVSDPGLRKRFEQEAKVASLIESDHVVEVVGAGIDPVSGSPWLAMELLRGEELNAKQVLASPNPLATAHGILRQICHAVGAAHRAGIVHRDLKPANVYLAESKRAGETSTVKVLDFGIAKITAEAATQHTAAMGSPIWMAPEQSEKGTVTAAADVWALGLVTYYLFTDKFFWHAAEDPNGSIHQVMREVLFEPIPLASMRAAEQGAPMLPPWFDAWFSRCVVRDAAARFPDATVAFAAFEAALGGQHISLVPPARVPSQHPPHTPSVPGVRLSTPSALPATTQPALTMPIAPEPPRRSRWPVLLFGLVAMGGVAFGAWRHRYGQAHVDPPKPLVDVPSATAELPTDDKLDPAPPLASGSAGPTKKKPPHGSASASSSAGSALSAALAEIGSSSPPPVTGPGRFDRPDAILKLNSIDLQRCATPDGPKGPSHVNVLFGNEGGPRQFFWERTGPYKDTPAETCMTALLRRAHVAPFNGPPQFVLVHVNLH